MMLIKNIKIPNISPKIIKNIGIPNMSNLSKTHVPCRNSNIRDQNQEYQNSKYLKSQQINFIKDYKNSKYLKAHQKSRILEHQISRISPKIIQVATRRTGPEWLFDQLHVGEGDRMPESV